MAVVAVPGIPRVSSGMNDDVDEALFADSGAATPSMAPLPKRSGWLEIRFSIAYEMKELMIPPPPGRAPMKKPITEPRIIGPHECRQSSREGSTCLRDVLKTSRISGLSRL